MLRDLYEQQGRDIEQQLEASNLSIEQLKQQRDRLRSAGGNAAGSRNSSGRNAAAAEEAARLEAMVKARRGGRGRREGGGVLRSSVLND